jgi:DNA polymerase
MSISAFGKHGQFRWVPSAKYHARPVVTIDFETRSEADLKKVGAWAYSEDLTTEVICVCWGVGNEPIRTWIPAAFGGSDDMPADLRKLVEDGAIIEAHNVAFERSVWQNVLTKRFGWVLPNDDQWRDTMAACAYYALPLSLEGAARALGYHGKDPDGTRLITKYSKLHLKTAKREIPPEDVVKFVDYCKRDVQIEQSISDHLGDLPDRELPVFLLDQKINMRGIYLDIDGIENATAIVDERSADLTAEFRALTGFGPAQHDKVKGWFASQGLELENLQAETLEELLENDLPSGPCRRAIEMRLAINKASTKKLDAMARQRGADGRARFQVKYHGALTGRWTGTGFQPLNLNRGFEDVEPDTLVRDISYRDPRWLDAVYGDAMDAVGKASRHWLTAGGGNVLYSGDFVSIEAVVLACLAGEEWKVEAFRNKAPIYAIMGCKIYGLPESLALELGDKGFKAKYGTERQDGKTGELAFGYQGALNAWLKFDSSGRHSDEKIIEICKGWRSAHPAIADYKTGFWVSLNRAAIQAVRNPGEVHHARSIGFEMVDEWLSMILPNGKRIWYYNPQLKMKMPKWHHPSPWEEKKNGELVCHEADEDCAAGTCDCEPEPYLTYMSQKEGQWKRVATYGGKLAENAVQATSREILVPAMMRAEKAGYEIILSVYDEIVAETKEGFGSTHEFVKIMAERPDFASEWPISVDAWTGKRYKK